MPTPANRIVIIGSGPIGLEAAATALTHGYSVTLLDRGDVAQNLADWGHVRLFTPFEMNAGPAGVALLRNAALELPHADELLTGRQFRNRYLLPLAGFLSNARIYTGAPVIAVGRSRLLKGEETGSGKRGEDTFRVLYEHAGSECEIEADIVLDCAGTYGNPNAIGQGGNPALGERMHRRAIQYGLPDVLGADRARYAGRRTLLIGSGHSAATTALALAALAREHVDTRFVWLTRSGELRVVEPIVNDSLPERAALTSSANQLASRMTPGSEWINGASVTEITNGARGAEGGRFTVALRDAAGTRAESFDEIVANVGYEPDDSHYRQLQIHECYASRGPMKLAAALLAASGSAAGVDCLALGGFGAEALVNPEPNYFILGAKSYGKNSAFLMRTGYEQVGDIFDLLSR
jgi:thioredoxin reductase